MMVSKTEILGFLKNLEKKYYDNNNIKWYIKEILKEISIEENVAQFLGKGSWLKRLHIGCWSNYLKWFCNIDIDGDADLICDVRKWFPIENDSIDLIFSEHMLEHLDYPLSVSIFFKECFRVLKKWWKLIIGVPDTELIINAYVKRDRNILKKFMDSWYKKRNHDNFMTYIDLVNYHMRDERFSDVYTPHLWAYDLEKLKSMGKMIWFKKSSKISFPKKYWNPKRKFGSIYVQYIK